MSSSPPASSKTRCHVQRSNWFSCLVFVLLSLGGAPIRLWAGSAGRFACWGRAKFAFWAPHRAQRLEAGRNRAASAAKRHKQFYDAIQITDTQLKKSPSGDHAVAARLTWLICFQSMSSVLQNLTLCFVDVIFSGSLRQRYRPDDISITLPCQTPNPGSLSSTCCVERPSQRSCTGGAGKLYWWGRGRRPTK